MDNTLENIIDLAIKKEEEAYSFYSDLMNKVKDSSVKDALNFLAGEEKKHKDFLMNYKNGNIPGDSLRMSEAIDYKIAQYIEAPDIDKDIMTNEVYLVAAHREMNSCNFYKGLAEIQPQGETKDILMRMANEEMKHKEKVEYLYANAAFPQTQGG